MRIVVAGDSVAHGQGDESHLSFATHLDGALTQLGIAHQLPVDLAISGSRASDSRARLLSSIAPRLMIDLVAG